MNDVDKNFFHRSISHSILFFLVISPLFGKMLSKLYPNDAVSTKKWTLLVFLCLFTHSLLDCFTNWGTQLFWPSHYMVSFKSIFVIDPVYTIPFMILLILALIVEKEDPFRRVLNWTGIAISTLYLCFTLLNKQIIDSKFEKIFENQKISYLRFETKPSPLNNILWTATVETEKGFYIGYYSFFDKKDSVDFQYFPKNHKLLKDIEFKDEIVKLQTISNGYYTVEEDSSGLVFNDLRFGTMTGWEKGGKFAFSYLITFNGAGEMVVEERKKKFEDIPFWLKKIGNRVFGNIDTISEDLPTEAAL